MFYTIGFKHRSVTSGQVEKVGILILEVILSPDSSQGRSGDSPPENVYMHRDEMVQLKAYFA